MNFENENNRINLLPEHLIDQIKAGEVVERPANVLKELLENSCDAGSSDIKITIEENGLNLIAIEDDGNGMFFDELPYAFCRHATSKISSFEDIYKLNTFGFRGEALASISSVSRISCHSAPKSDLESGGKILIHGAQTKEHAHYRPSKSGTAIYVKDLFFNTPVRLKFVKSKVSEKNALKRIINAFLFTNPTKKFTVSWDDNDKDIYSAVNEDEVERRINQIIGRKKQYEFMSTQASYLGSRVKAYISKDASKGYAGKHHYLFVNNRLFTDKKIHQIIIRNMEKFWPYGLTGHYFIKIDVPEHEIDVNVHPNKTLIKFLKSNEIFSLISATVKKLIDENKGTEFGHSKEDQRPMQMGFSQQSPIQEVFDSPVWQKFQDPQAQDQTAQYTQIGQGDIFDSQSGDTLISCGANIFMLKSTDNTLYLINMEKGLRHLLNKIEKIKEVPVTPLLISEPMSFQKLDSEKDILEGLYDYGFEIDRIDDQTLVLRSTPTLLESYDYKRLAVELITKAFISEGKLDFKNLDLDELQVSHSNATKFVLNSNLIELIKDSVAKKISGKDLKKKFYAKK